jgi:hypothetical protein
MENFNRKNNFTTDIDEAGGGVRGTVVTKLVGDAKSFKALSKEAKLVFADMESAIKLNQNPIMLGNKPLKTGEEIFMAIKDGSLLKSPKELARVEKGFLKSANTEANMRQVIATSFAADANVLKELANSNKSTVKDIKKYISDKGYPKSSVDEIVKQMQINGAIKDGKLVKDASSVVKTGGSTAKSGKSIWSRAKELVTNIKVKKMTWKQLLAWGTGIGLGGAALWYYIKQYSDVLPKDMPNTPPQDWGPCLNYMIKNMGARIKQSPTQGMVVTTVPNAEYPGGVQFYSNGRMVNLQTKDKGTWKCVGGQAQTNENMSKTQVNESIGQIVKRVLNERYLMEQSDVEIDKDVNKMIDFLDWPVSQSNLQDAYNLLVRYSTSPKVKEFLHYYEKSGLANTSLSTTLSMIFTKEPGSVRLKEKLIALLDQIESGTVKPIVQTSNTNTNTGSTGFKMTTLKEQELQMSWDKDRKPGSGGGNTGGGGTGGGSTTRRTYYDCSGVNIETTPLTYGCKDTKIGEIQACLGITSDNKFGPNTRNKLIEKGHDVKNGITKAIYDKVKANCSQTASTQTYADNSAALTSDYMKRNPIKMDLGPVPQMPTKNTSASGASASEGMTGEDYYTSLLQKGLINPSSFLGKRKVAYNGPVLGQSDIQRLNNFLEGKNYFQTNDEAYKLTDAGERYVWIQQ